MRKFFFLCGLIVPFLQADPVITTNVGCQSYGAPAISAQSSCSEGGPFIPNVTSPSYAFANSTATVTLQQAATDWLTISFRNTVNAVDGGLYLYEHGQIPANQFDAPASSSAALAVHIDSYTLGPVRPGILQVQWAPQWLGNPGDFSAAAGYSLQDPLLGSGAFTGGCMGYLGNCTGPGPLTLPIPFELGTDFAFDAWATLYADSVDGNSYGYDGMTVAFRFFEADGFTPVLSYDPPVDAPEPATWGLAVFAGIGILIVAKRLKSS